MRYTVDVIDRAKNLRARGKTYTEIKTDLDLKIPKSTLVSWFRNIKLPSDYSERIRLLNYQNLIKARRINVENHKQSRKLEIESYQVKNKKLVDKITNKDFAKIALAMLWLGEGSKQRGVFRLGSSDPRIIIFFLEFIKKCYKFDINRVRCTVQCRVDQNISKLENYWMKIANVPKRLFYKTRIDPRTVGKATLNKEYNGVLRVDYFDVKIQDEMATIVNMLYNKISSGPEV